MLPGYGAGVGLGSEVECMGDAIRIDVDTRNLRLLAETFGGRQAEYAIARALTDAAKAGQKRAIDTLPGSVTLRTDRIPKGLRIQPAQKKGPKVAYVGSRDLTMAMMATGGERTATSGSGPVAVPMLGTGRPTAKTVTKRSMFPGALLRKGKGALFIGDLNGAVGLWQKTGDPQPRQRARMVLGKLRKGGSVYPAKPLELVYRIVPSAEMKPGSWPFDRIVRYAVGESWEPACVRALEEVARTAHRKARK